MTPKQIRRRNERMSAYVADQMANGGSAAPKDFIRGLNQGLQPGRCNIPGDRFRKPKRARLSLRDLSLIGTIALIFTFSVWLIYAGFIVGRSALDLKRELDTHQLETQHVRSKSRLSTRN